MVQITISVDIEAGAGQGKSTVALIIERALTEAGIDFSYNKDDLEMKERSPEFIQRTLINMKLDKIKDYGIHVKMATKQIARESIKGKRK